MVIGDTMDADILGGVQLHYKTILVLTGSTRREDVDRFAYRPDLIVDSIADLDPIALEHRFASLPGPGSAGVSHAHPSPRPRRQPAVVAAF